MSRFITNDRCTASTSLVMPAGTEANLRSSYDIQQCTRQFILKASNHENGKNPGITNRGIIRVGYAADLVLFDPETVQDNATFEDSLQYSTGIDAVWVNGELVWKDGHATDARPGQIIRRSNMGLE